CDAGNWLIGVSPSGMVSPCSFVEGDEFAVGELPGKWKDDTTFSVYRDWDRDTKSACARCDYVSICKGGCHAVANFVTGSSLEPDPECPMIAGNAW
ncbi:MAG: SPASM domain-containing protein, partial [Spirochaetes bacterium]|nr:SPASM domain-containing protein [Spirochaetota bacterium]